MKLPQNYEMLNSRERRAVRELYISQQKGLCHYCGASLQGPPAKKIAAKEVTERFFPEGFFNYPIHLHHSHDDGMTIGAVHAHCNAVLWEWEGE